MYGSRHTINVPLHQAGTTRVPVHPDAPALKASMQAAVKAGTVGSKEAAARLVALLRQEVGGNAAAAAAAAAIAGPGLTLKAPPPGFGGGGVSAPFINHNDPSVSGPPLNRYQPIQPPIQAPSIQLFGAAPGPRSAYDPFGGIGGGSSGGGQYQPFGGKSYSLWSNLPGIDLGLGASLWQGQNTLGGGHGSGLHMSGGGAERRTSAVFGGGDVSSNQHGGGTAMSSSTSSLDPVVGYSSGGGGSKMPPPGFGLGGGGSTGDLSQAKGRSFQPFGAIGPASAAVGSGGGGANATTGQGYNPLQTQATAGAGAVGGVAGRAPPPGMTQQYRPQQLGVGL